jgi:hypothetical protein
MNPIRNWDFSRRLEEASRNMVASVSNYTREAEEKKQEEVSDQLPAEEAPAIGEVLEPVPIAADNLLNSNVIRNRLAQYILTYLPSAVSSVQLRFPGYSFIIQSPMNTVYVQENGELRTPTRADRVNALNFLRDGNPDVLERLIFLEDSDRTLALEEMRIIAFGRDLVGEPLNAETLTQIFPNWNEPFPEIAPENEPIQAIQEAPAIGEEIILDAAPENELLNELIIEEEEIEDEPIIEIEEAVERNPESRIGRIVRSSRSWFSNGIEGVRDLGSAFVRSPSRGLYNLVARPLNLIATAFSRFEQQRIRVNQ